MLKSIGESFCGEQAVLQAGAGAIHGPIAVIGVGVGHGEGLVPLVDVAHEGVGAAGRNAEGGVVEAVPAAVDVVRAGGRPEAVPRPGRSDGPQDGRGVGVVVLDVGEVLRAAAGQRPAVFAEEPEDVPQRPGVVGRLDGEERHLDEVVVVLREQALPFLVPVGSHALLRRRVHLFVGDPHEVLELQLVLVPLGDVVRRVEEDARVRQGEHPRGLRGAVDDVVCPEVGGQAAGRLPGDDDIGGGEEPVEGVEGVQLGDGHVMAAEVEVLALERNGVLLVALVAGPVAVLEVHDGPVAVGVERVVGEDAVGLLPDGPVAGRAAEVGVAAGEAVVEHVLQALAAAAPPATLEAEQELLLLPALVDVVGATRPVQAERVRLAQPHQRETGRAPRLQPEKQQHCESKHLSPEHLRYANSNDKLIRISSALAFYWYLRARMPESALR